MQLYSDRKKDNKKKGSDDEDEETTVQQNSEEEDESNEGSFIDMIAQNIPRIVASLEIQAKAGSEIETSYDKRIVPLGSLRLKLIELIYQIMKLGKESTSKAIVDSDFFKKLSLLVEAYPWNNFLHLKLISIYEDLLESTNVDFVRSALASSQIGETLIALAAKSSFGHVSGRPIRHGYMAVIIKIANVLSKSKNEAAASYLESLGDDWKTFTEGELKASNDKNTRSLGGQQPRSNPGDDDDMEGAMSMDSILSRFTNFSTERNKRETSQHEDDEEDDDDEEEEDEEEEQDDKKGGAGADGQTTLKEDEVKTEKFTFKEEAPLVKEYTDNTYWNNVELYQEKSLEEMLAEMEI